MRLVTAVTVLALTASMALASMGIPEDIMLVALATVAVLAVGLALVRLFVFLERNGFRCSNPTSPRPHSAPTDDPFSSRYRSTDR